VLARYPHDAAAEGVQQLVWFFVVGPAGSVKPLMQAEDAERLFEQMHRVPLEASLRRAMGMN